MKLDKDHPLYKYEEEGYLFLTSLDSKKGLHIILKFKNNTGLKVSFSEYSNEKYFGIITPLIFIDEFDFKEKYMSHAEKYSGIFNSKESLINKIENTITYDAQLSLPNKENK